MAHSLRLPLGGMLVIAALALPVGPLHAESPPLFGESLPEDERTYALSLDEAIAIAQQRSFRAGRSQRNREQAELRYHDAKAGYGPRVDLRGIVDQSARGFRFEADDFAPFVRPTRGEFRAGASVNASLPLDVFGVVGRQVKQAEFGRGFSEQDIAQTGIDIRHEVQNHYLSALRAQNALDAEQAVVERLEALLARSSSHAPALQPFIEVELRNAQQSLNATRSQSDQAQDGLKQALRIPPEARLRLTTQIDRRTAPVERDGLLAQALNNRPDIRQADLRIAQSRNSRRQVGDYRKPSVALGAFADQQFSGRSAVSGNYDEFRSHGAGVTLTAPIFQYDGGVLERQRRAADIQIAQAMADRAELEERITYELRQALLALGRAEDRLDSLPDVEQAQLALERAEAQMLFAESAQAQALIAQVSNARSAWRFARTAASDAYIDYNMAVFRLQRIVAENAPFDPPETDY